MRGPGRVARAELVAREGRPLTRWERIKARFRPPRRVLPTRAGAATLITPLVLGIAAINASNNLLFLLVGACLGMIVLSGIISERLVRVLEVEVAACGAVRSGERARLSVRFHRPGTGAPLFDLRVRERTRDRDGRKVPAEQCLDARLSIVEGHEGTTLAERTFPRRGRASLRPLELLTRYPFGLLTKACDLDTILDVLVRPRAVEVPERLADPRGLVAEGRAAARRGAGDDFYTLRERDERDLDARVHALRSLRIGHEVVVETEATARPVAWIGVANAAGADPEALERALELAQAALEAWDRRGWAVGLIVGERALGPESASLDTLLDALALVEVEAAAQALDERAVWLIPAGARVVLHGAPVLLDVGAGGALSERATRAAA